MKFLDVYFTANNCYIVTEYCDGGTLQAAIDDRVAIDWGMVIYQVGQACQYLANQNIMHRDIKPANVLLKEGVWKLSDFGFAQELSNMNSIVKEDYLIGSPLYMPLESLSTNLYSSKSDSFALGVFIYYLLFHHYPW
jgi:serine/threonine protein kinase